MADAKKCDVCGRFYMPPLGSIGDDGYHLLFVGEFTSTSGRKYDLCPICKEKLKIFVESLKKVNNND